jgi:hypothetical protein
MRTSQMFDGHAGEPPKREGLTSANYRQASYARGLDHILTEEFVIEL